MNVRYTKRAFADRAKIFEYLSERNEQAARVVVSLIHRRIVELGDQPYKGRAPTSRASLRYGSRLIGIEFFIASMMRK